MAITQSGASMESISPDRSDWQRIPARRGVAAKAGHGQVIKVINTSGKQVVDTWAFNADDFDEHLSMEHSRVALMKLVPAVGDALVTNHRRPILSFVEDTTAGIHDMLMAACDVYRYELLGAIRYHDNCTDNLRNALQAIGLRSKTTPSPLNLFMNVPWADDGKLAYVRPTSEAGQYVCLRAVMDLIVVFSSCPKDMIPVNGMRSTNAHFTIT